MSIVQLNFFHEGLSHDDIVHKNKILVQEIKDSETKESLSVLDLFGLNNDPIWKEQSKRIRLGRIAERILHDICSSSNSVRDVSSLTNSLRLSREVDLALEKNNSDLYLFEVKTNLNLDTGKSINEFEKLESFEDFFRLNSKIRNSQFKILCPFWSSNYKGKSFKVKNSIKDRCIFAKDFVNIIDVDFDENSWYSLFHEIGKGTKATV